MSETIHNLCVRVSEEDYVVIKAKINASGMSEKDYIIGVLLEKEVSRDGDLKMLADCRSVLKPVITSLNELPDSIEKDRLKEEVRKAWLQIKSFQLEANRQTKC